MAGLVAYESSDEEEEVAPQPESKPLKPSQDTPVAVNREPSASTRPDALSQKEPEKAQQEAVIGPQMGPAPAPAAGPSFAPLEEAPMDDDDEGGAGSSSRSGLPPGSPYTATRALLRDLTLPPEPDTAIPPSPPGSPPGATSAKFERFLELKKQGVHFNSKIAQNPAMGNPALADKLLAFVGLGAPADQYRTTLSPDLWDPVAAFPRSAYREQLRQAQIEGDKARARAKGAPVDFVSGSATASTSASASADAGAGVGDQGTVQQSSSQGGPPKQTAGKRKTRFDT
ncbi:HCNGP-like protein-domain-containing protein [Hypoxylon sp. FL1284]|nr:HCNGP-like protein-domain-containing protein [Hypoxylon sp. FL1284]